MISNSKSEAVSDETRPIRLLVLVIVASVGLAGIKILGGVFGGSRALIADGTESILDILSTVIVWSGLRISAHPPDESFHYGYGKAESLAALTVSSLLILTAIGLAIQSIVGLFSPHPPPQSFTLFILVVVVLVKELMFRVLLKIGKRIGSHSLESDAWHHRSDALTSLAAFCGISIAIFAGPGFEQADNWAALLACAIIAFNGIRLFQRAFADILDVSPPEAVIQKIRQIATSVPGVLAVDKCRVRKSGIGIFNDLQIVVDGNITVREGHDLGHEVKDRLMASELGLLDVFVHIEPDVDRRRKRVT